MDTRVLALLLCVQLLQLLLSAPPSTEAMSIAGPQTQPPPGSGMPGKTPWYSNCSRRPGGCGLLAGKGEDRPAPTPPPQLPPPPPPRIIM
ncbi:uncharacterized protein [Syngnathus scovelli]|uniref:uncharacterized protein n=1 Tax=Syngnathus scovelli TaxID=161590 RepID=UPI0035CB896C